MTKKEAVNVDSLLLEKFPWKKYEDLTFADDFMFCRVLMDRPDLCREMVEIVTGRKVKEIRNLVAQPSEKEYYDGKGVRFDVYFEDEEKTVYDFEMQTVLKDALPRRVRYYQSMIDTTHLKMGKKYEDLPDSYIVFICLEDPFNSDRPKYTFHDRCDEDQEMTLEDGKTSIFLNASSSQMQDGELKDFLRYVGKKTVSSEFTQRIDNEVQRIIENHEGRRHYMLLEEKIEDAAKLAEMQGRKKGILETLISLVKRGKLTLDEASEQAGMSKEEFQKHMEVR